MRLGHVDSHGDQIDGTDNVIHGGGGNDTIEGGGGADTIEGGAGNDLIYGDTEGDVRFGTLNPTNSDNLQDENQTEAWQTRAVELIELPNGKLVMITSERLASTDGIASYQIDNDPSSSTYGQIIGTQISKVTEASIGNGFHNIEAMSSITLSSGVTYVYTADHDTDTIGIVKVNLDGSLTYVDHLTSVNLDEVGELSAVEVGGKSFLLATAGGSADALTVYEIGLDGRLTQTDIEHDQSGTAENFLAESGQSSSSLLESFTNSSGQTFVITGGSENGIALWTLDSNGQLTIQDARADDAAGAGDTNPAGEALTRDLISPTETGLWHVSAGAFAEIDGQTYLFVGGTDDDVVIFRVDGTTSYDLTLVGQLDNAVIDISSMAFLQTDDGGALVVGGEQSGLNFYGITVNGDGTVTLTLTNTVADGPEGGAELLDSEDIDVAGGLLVSASDYDSGVAIIDTGLNDPDLVGDPGNDSITGGAGNDTIYAGEGNDTIVLEDNFGTDVVAGGEDADLSDIDLLDASGITLTGVNVVLSGDEAGTLTAGSSAVTFTQIEAFNLTDLADLFDGSAASAPVIISAGAGDDSITGTSGSDTIYGEEGNDTLNGGAGADQLYGGDGNDSISAGTGTDTLEGGLGNDTLAGNGGADVLSGGDGDDSLAGGLGNDTLDGGSGNDTLTGGSGDDVFVYSGGSDVITDFNFGNTGAINDGDTANNDFVDLSGYYDTLYELWADQRDDGILNQSNTVDTRGNAVDYGDNTQFGTGSLTFTGATGDRYSFNQDNTGVVCFTHGTLIRTPSGDVPIQSLKAGDLVVTRDNGVKPLLWIGYRHLDGAVLTAQPHLRPVLLKHSFFGFDRDLVVSPQHGVLLRSDLRGGDEVLYRAIHLARLPGGAARQMLGCRSVTYIHLLFDQHEVVFANGLPSESLYPGRTAIRSMNIAAQSEVLELFPDLQRFDPAMAYGSPARTYSRTGLLPDHLRELRLAG
nr:Hint domain-containing protein [Donghicola mangrovi]